MTYEFTPKRNIKGASVLSLSLFVLSVALFFAASSKLFGEAALLQLMGTLFGTAAIFILVKFIVMSYVYTISPTEDGSADLYVIENSAKRRATLCLISLGSVKELVELADGKISNSAASDCKKVYNFCLELFASRAWALVVEDGDGKYAIKLPHDDEMIEMIRKYVK